MSVSEDQIRDLAKLVRLNLEYTPGGEKSTVTLFSEQLNGVITLLDCIKSIDTAGVDPLYSPMQQVAGPRPDNAEKLRSTASVLANAPEKKDTFFVVPPVL